MPAHLELYFSGAPIPELTRTVFVSPYPAERIVAYRQSRNATAFNQDSFLGQFAWSSAVQAATVLLLRTAAAGRIASDRTDRETLQGGEHSLAGRLESTIRKEPNWLLDMFGVSERGESNTKRIFSCATNGGTTFTVYVDREFLPAKRIMIFIDGTEVTSATAIYELACCVEDQPVRTQSPTTTTPLAAPAARVAAESESGEAIFFSSVDARLVVLNRHGDAQMTFEKKVENLGSESMSSTAFDVWLDSSYEDFQVEAWDDVAESIPVTISCDQPLYKRVKIQFPQGIPPLGKRSFGYRYFVPRLFKDDPSNRMNWWAIGIREQAAHISLEIVDTRYNKLDSFMTVHESEERQVVQDAIKTTMRKTNQGIVLSWSRAFPPVRHMFKTFWIGADPICAEVFEADSRRDKETSLALS